MDGLPLNLVSQFVGDLWQMAKTAGPFATCLLLILYFLERRDRKAAQDGILVLTTNGLKAMIGMERALDALELRATSVLVSKAEQAVEEKAGAAGSTG